MKKHCNDCFWRNLQDEQEHEIKELRKELVQVAAVAIAFLECLDRNHR